MLADDLVERYSRQILLPDVGGRGQERLCASHARIAGDDPAARLASALLDAAGVRVSTAGGPAGAVAVALDAGGDVLARWHATAGVVATLVGRPCARCLAPGTLALAASATDDGRRAAAEVTGALVAAETLRLALGIATAGRVQRLDLERGVFDGRSIAPVAGCAGCGVA